MIQVELSPYFSASVAIGRAQVACPDLPHMTNTGSIVIIAWTTILPFVEFRASERRLLRKSIPYCIREIIREAGGGKEGGDERGGEAAGAALAATRVRRG